MIDRDGRAGEQPAEGHSQGDPVGRHAKAALPSHVAGSANSVVPFPFVICPCGDTLKGDERCPKCGTWFRLNDAK